MNQNGTENLHQNKDNAFVLNLGELLLRVFDKLPIIILGAIIGGLLLAVYSTIGYQPKYRTVAKIYLVDTKDKEVIDYSDLQLGNTLAYDYLKIFEMDTLGEIAKGYLDKNHQDAFEDVEITPSNPEYTHMIYVTGSSTSPENAQLVVNAYADAACDFIEEYMMVPRPTVLERAPLVTEPYSLSRGMNIALGAVGGALLVTLIYMLIFIFDDRIEKSEDISKYFDLPCLGVISTNDSKSKGNNSRKGKKNGKHHNSK